LHRPSEAATLARAVVDRTDRQTWSRSRAAARARPPAPERRELRLAVVCYRGVSLCVYMHGMTKEIYRLVKASRLLAVGDGDGADASESERVHRDLLAHAAGPDGPRLEVVVDVIAGTSAGGINWNRTAARASSTASGSATSGGSSRGATARTTTCGEGSTPRSG
jgi:hypothetical protein